MCWQRLTVPGIFDFTVLLLSIALHCPFAYVCVAVAVVIARRGLEPSGIWNVESGICAPLRGGGGGGYTVRWFIQLLGQWMGLARLAASSKEAALQGPGQAQQLNRP